MIKKTIFSFLFFLFFQLLIQDILAQKILIPFRVNNKWGLSDTSGSIVLTAQYDKVLVREKDNSGIIRQFYSDFYYVMKGEGIGVAGEKEIISPIYEKIDCVKNQIFIATNDNIPKLFTSKGNLLLPKGYTFVSCLFICSSTAALQDNHYLFDVVDVYKKHAVFYYNFKKPNLSKILFSNTKNIDVVESIVDKNQVLIKTNNVNNNALYYNIRLNNEDQCMHIINQSIDYNKVKKVRNELNNEDEIIYDNPIEAPYNDEILTDLKKSCKLEGGYVFLNETLNIEVSKSAEDKTHITKTFLIKVKLPKDFTDLKITPYLYSIGTASSNIVQSDSGKLFLKNYVTYKLNGKYYLLTGTKTIDFGFDSLEQTFYKHFAYSPDCFNFIFGILNNDKEMKYGLIDINGKVIIPAQYQKLDWLKDNILNCSNLNYGYDFIAKKNDKYSLIDYRNHIIQAPIFDTIYKVCGLEKSASFYVFKKDGYYGSMVKQNLSTFSTYGGPWYYVPLFTENPITNVLYLKDAESDQDYIILEIRNLNGELIGYANKNGKKYYTN